jgi:hypothetical protein
VVDEISRNKISRNFTKEFLSYFAKFLCLFREISRNFVSRNKRNFAKFREIFATKFRFLPDKAKYNVAVTEQETSPSFLSPFST